MNSTVKLGEQSLVKDERHELHRRSSFTRSVHPVWRWSSCRSSFTRLCSPRLTVEFMSLIFYQTLFTPFDGGVHVAHLLPDSVHPVWRWSSCRSSFTRLCSPKRWSSCRSSFTRLCSPRLTVEFMSLIFYQTLFTPFDGGVHVAHLLPDSVHPVWRWSSCRSSFTRLCSPCLTVEIMSLIFYQTDRRSCRHELHRQTGWTESGNLLPDSVHHRQTGWTDLVKDSVHPNVWHGVHPLIFWTDSVNPVWATWSSCRSNFYQTLVKVWATWSSCRSSFTRWATELTQTGWTSLVKDERHELHRQTGWTESGKRCLTVEFMSLMSDMSLIFYQTLFTPFDGGVHVAHLLPDSVHPVWRWSSCRSSFTRLCSPRLTVEFMSLIFYQTLFTPFDGGVHVAHLLPDSVHPVWRWSSCRSSFTRLCSPRLTVEFMSLIFYQTLFTPFDGGVHVAHLLPDSVHPVWRWSFAQSGKRWATLFTQSDGGVHVAHTRLWGEHPELHRWRWSSCRKLGQSLVWPDSVHPTVWRWSSCRSSFTRLCSPRLTVEFMSLIFYQTLFTPFDGGVHVAHLLPDSVHPVWRWSSCRSSFTRLCSPRLTVEFMSLIFYQTLFTQFDGGVHVAHLLPDSVHPTTVEFMSLIFYQTLFTPFDGGVHVAHLLPDSVHPVWRWSSCRSSFTRLCSPRLTVEFMSLIFYQTLFTPFDGGVHVAHLLPDSVHPVWRWSSCRSSFTRLCSPSLTVEFMSLIFYQTLFTPFDGGVHVAHLLPDSVHPVWRWSSCRSSFTRLCSPRLTVEFMSLIFYQTLFTPFDGGVHVAHLLPDSVHPVWRWSSCRSSFTRLCSPSLTVEFMSLIFYQTLFTPFDGGVHVAHLLPDSVHPVWRWSSCRSSFTRLCSPRLTVEFMSLIFYQTLFTPFDGGVHVALVKDRHELHRQTGWTESGKRWARLCQTGWTKDERHELHRQTGWTESVKDDGGVHVAHLLPDSVHPKMTVEFMSLIFYQTLFTPFDESGDSCQIFYQTLFTPFDGGVHVAHLLPDSVHPVWRWSSCRSSFTRLCSPRLTVEFMSLIFYQTLFTPFDGGVHVAHLLPDSVHPVWRWSSCRSSFTRLCSPRWSSCRSSFTRLCSPRTVEFMSLIFYQTLFTQFDGGVHVAHLLPDSVHPVWRWSSCRSSFTRLCSPRLTVEFMSLIFYQTLFTPFDGGVHVAHLLPDSVHPTVEFMSLIFYQTLFTPFDGGVHVAHLLPDSVHPVWRWSSCRSSFTRLCSPRLTVEFMSLIFYQTLFTPFDGGVHVAHLLPDSVHPVWRWSSCRSSFTRLCSPRLTVEFMSLIFYQTLFTQFDGGVHVAHLLPDSVHPVWRWSSCRSSFTRLCSPRLTVEFMSLIFYQTLFTPFDGGVHVAHLLPDSVHPVWRWSSCRSSFTRLCSPRLTVEFMSLIFYQTLFTPFDGWTPFDEFMSLIFYQTLFTPFDGGVHVAHLLPDSVHPVWRWSKRCHVDMTRLHRLTVEQSLVERHELHRHGVNRVCKRWAPHRLTVEFMSSNSESGLNPETQSLFTPPLNRVW